MRTRRGRRHQRFVERYGCDCRRHEGMDVALARMAADLNTAALDQHELRALDGGRR